MVLFIGAIMSIDSELYEAADLDGANKFQQFFHIILPSIKTILTLNIILSITGQYRNTINLFQKLMKKFIKSYSNFCFSRGVA